MSIQIITDPPYVCSSKYNNSTCSVDDINSENDVIESIFFESKSISSSIFLKSIFIYKIRSEINFDFETVALSLSRSPLFTFRLKYLPKKEKKKLASQNVYQIL